MERWTWTYRDVNGVAHIRAELTPKEVARYGAIQKLAEYEDAEAEGRLVVTKVAIGDKVHDTGMNEIERAIKDLVKAMDEEVASVVREKGVKYVIQAIREKREGEKEPKPLTLEQLRDMDGEPVWIVEHPEWGHWELSMDADDYISDRDTDFYGMTHDDPAGRYGLHLLGWLAYTHKPKEARR